jgi:hypothetical protein
MTPYTTGVWVFYFQQTQNGFSLVAETFTVIPENAQHLSQNPSMSDSAGFRVPPVAAPE